MQTESGRSACEAQDEVLVICDQLYLSNKITENQLLYLRHRVLIREETVATLYDQFQGHQNVQYFARQLYELANKRDQDEEGEEEESTTQGTQGSATTDNSDYGAAIAPLERPSTARGGSRGHLFILFDFN